MQITDANGTREQDIPGAFNFVNAEGIAWHEALNIGGQTSSYLMIETAGDGETPLSCHGE